MTKRIAMIPVLLGSTRIEDKNLLLVDGYPLIFYVVKACKEAGIFDDIYINSEHDEFLKIADMLGVQFYRRKSEKGGTTCTMKNKSRDCAGKRCQVHDHFISDFLDNVACDYLIQVHTTSPLLEPQTIRAFTESLENNIYDSLFSIEQKYAETFFDGQPVNFSKCTKKMTQGLPPLQIISWALSGWKSQSFLDSFYKNDPSEDGPTFCGKMGLFPISKIEALDADDWEDLFIVEACLRHRKHRDGLGKQRFTKRIVEIDSDLVRLITRDGVDQFSKIGYNKPINSFEKIKKSMGDSSWCFPLIYTDNDQACLISQQPGEGCRRHYHATKDEWWIVVEGSFEWRLDDGQVITAQNGEIVFLPKGTVHKIVCTSDKPGIRLACGGRDMEHIYVE
jgi:CMP-N-acetylneuraminic acid synthetase/quercetin dioxygenase-like cupin family protein